MTPDSEPASGDRPRTGDELSGLYPTPQTYDQRMERYERAAQLRQKRRPKLTLISACLITGLIFALLFDTGNTADTVFGLFGSMTGVFVLFLLGMSMAGLVIWQLRRCVQFFADRGYGAAWFVWLYLFTAFATLWLYTAAAPNDSWATRLLFAGGHAVVMISIAGLALRARRQS